VCPQSQSKKVCHRVKPQIHCCLEARRWEAGRQNILNSVMANSLLHFIMDVIYVYFNFQMLILCHILRVFISNYIPQRYSHDSSLDHFPIIIIIESLEYDLYFEVAIHFRNKQYMLSSVMVTRTEAIHSVFCPSEYVNRTGGVQFVCILSKLYIHFLEQC
jgi:hypothetical protein